jgi:hypothetical protein
MPLVAEWASPASVDPGTSARLVVGAGRRQSAEIERLEWGMVGLRLFLCAPLQVSTAHGVGPKILRRAGPLYSASYVYKYSSPSRTSDEKFLL